MKIPNDISASDEKDLTVRSRRLFLFLRFALYVHHPETMAHGYQGERMMFSLPRNVTPNGFFGIDGLRIFLPAEAFEALVRELPMNVLKVHWHKS